MSIVSTRPGRAPFWPSDAIASGAKRCRRMKSLRLSLRLKPICRPKPKPVNRPRSKLLIQRKTFCNPLPRRW